MATRCVAGRDRRGSRRIIAAVIPTPRARGPAPASAAAGPARGRPRRSTSPRRSATCPGLALLESARPGRNARWTYLTADPVAVLESPAAGPDPFAVARRLVARLDRTVVVPADAPPFLGGLVGFLGYDLGRALERLPSIARRRPGPAAAAARAPRLGRRLGPADRATPGSAAGRSTATAGGSPRRLDDVHARLTSARRPLASPIGADGDARRPLDFRSGLDRAAYEAGVERGPRAHRPRRHLPGQPDPPARDPVRRRPVGPATGACGPATRRSSRRTSTSGRAS